ncbi:MAG: hypothetical protein GTN76_06005 [Candidatus Aenigmarchaeota archaeon]|nr:hypothetical protein [Candidatus Aenigmarchaeota archaeon]
MHTKSSLIEKNPKEDNDKDSTPYEKSTEHQRLFPSSYVVEDKPDEEK